MLNEGDVNARVWIRVREVEQSLSLIDQILDRLPAGPIAQPDAPTGRSARRHGASSRDSAATFWSGSACAMAGSSAAICATHRGSSGRCSRPPSRATSSRIFRSATNRSTVPIRARISRHAHAQAAFSKPVSLARSPSRRPRPTMPRWPNSRPRVGRAARRRLGRSLSIREVDAGSCNGCELEIHALNNAYYDVERFGLRFVASPRHADVLMVTGPVTKNMREALERTYRRDPRSQMGGRGRRLRAGWRLFRRQLCGRRRRLRGDPGRPAYSRLPACRRWRCCRAFWLFSMLRPKAPVRPDARAYDFSIAISAPLASSFETHRSAMLLRMRSSGLAESDPHGEERVTQASVRSLRKLSYDRASRTMRPRGKR